jgi:hypothetical protein
MKAALLLALFALSAGVAQAQPMAPSGLAPLPGSPSGVAQGRQPDLAGVRVLLAAPYAEAYALRAAGIARTSVDRRLGPSPVNGALGLLCGRQPDAGMSGAAAASGYDPDGKFVGAKLSLAF